MDTTAGKRKKGLRFLAGALMALLIAGLGLGMVSTYQAYTRLMVSQQQQHLLITARAVSQNLSLCLSQQLRSVDILTRTPGFLESMDIYEQTGETSHLKEYILSYMLSQSYGPSRIYLLDRSGNEIFHYNQYPFLDDFDESCLHLEELAERRQSGVGSVFPIGEHHYGISLISGIIDGSDYVGTAVLLLDLENIYEEYVAPLEAQGTGNITVKDAAGTIIMDDSQQMLSFNYFRDIADLDALPQYASMREMLNDQYQYEEGSAIYRSFSNGVRPARNEVASFSRMNLGSTTWYISSVMSYSEAVSRVSEALGRFVALSVSVVALLLIWSFIILRLQRNRQKLEMETQYLKDLNHTLEELHQSREQVNHYQKLQTIGALAGGIVHEFNNLLTPIMGYSEFLKKQLGTENEYYNDISEIYSAGARAKEIVEQILPFSRRETDSSSYGPVNLNAVLRDALKTVRLILPATITLEEDLTNERINVYGSATQLHQVMLNLCSNAYQAMEGTEGVLTVRLRLMPQEIVPPERQLPGEEVCALIQVSDTGCGIPQDILTHIFDPFFTTKSLDEGTGLGLSVVKNILISHGGSIEAKSEVGQGSTFLVYLPVTHLPAVPPAATAPLYEETEASDKVSVLLLDDDKRVVRYLKRRLAHIGYQVDACTEPELALAEFRRTPTRWDLLIIDQTMPRCKGTTLAVEMKKLNSAVPVLLITGLPERETLVLQQRGLIQELLLKPVDFEELLQAITRALEE